jgi:hypothetical protein
MRLSARSPASVVARGSFERIYGRGGYGAQMSGYWQGCPSRAQCQPLQPEDEAAVSAKPAAHLGSLGRSRLGSVRLRLTAAAIRTIENKDGSIGSYAHARSNALAGDPAPETPGGAGRNTQQRLDGHARFSLLKSPLRPHRSGEPEPIALGSSICSIAVNWFTRARFHSRYN